MPYFEKGGGTIGVGVERFQRGGEHRKMVGEKKRNLEEREKKERPNDACIRGYWVRDQGGTASGVERAL